MTDTLKHLGLSSVCLEYLLDYMFNDSNNSKEEIQVRGDQTSTFKIIIAALKTYQTIVVRNDPIVLVDLSIFQLIVLCRIAEGADLGRGRALGRHRI